MVNWSRSSPRSHKLVKAGSMVDLWSWNQRYLTIFFRTQQIWKRKYWINWLRKVNLRLIAMMTFGNAWTLCVTRDNWKACGRKEMRHGKRGANSALILDGPPDLCYRRYWTCRLVACAPLGSRWGGCSVPRP